MSVQLLNEKLISLPAAARMFPGGRGGSGMNPSTCYRWATAGAVAPDGTRVRLESVRAGGRTLTSVEAVRQFVAKLTPPPGEAAPGGPGGPCARTPSERQRAAARAGEALKRKGA